MYSESRNITYELKKCVLKNLASGVPLLEFDARAITEYTYSGGFAGSGIASGSHRYSIATATTFDFEPFNHAVIINGVKFIITSKRFITHNNMGECFGKRSKNEIVLELE